MAIQYIGSATGTTSATLPAHQAGDLILAFAFRDGSTTAATLPSGWTSIQANGANACSGRIAYRVATASGTTTGTWTNATSVVFLVYRDTDQHNPIGNRNTATGSSSTVNYPAIAVPSGGWVVGFAGHVSPDVNLTAPSLMTRRAVVADATDEAAGHDTNGDVASWSSTNTSVGGTAGGWRSYVLEIKPPVSATANVDSVELEAISGEWLPASSDWYAWAFNRTYILFASGDAIVSVQGEESTISVGEVTAFVSTNASVSVEGIESLLSAESITSSGGAIAVCSDIVATTSIQELLAYGGATSAEISSEISSEFGLISGSGDAETEVIGQGASAEIEVITAIGGALSNLNGVESESAVENITSSGTGNVELSGEDLQIQAGQVFGIGSEIVNAQVSLSGIELSVSQGNVTASAVSGEILQLSGNPKRYSADQFKYATVKITGIASKITLGNAKALGTVSISKTANVQSVEGYSQIQKISAQGILSISDEELIYLMVA